MPRSKKSTPGRPRKESRATSDASGLAMMAMGCAVRQGITPETYRRFWNMVNDSDFDISIFPALTDVVRPAAISSLLKKTSDSGFFADMPYSTAKLTRSGRPRKKRRVGQPVYRHTPLPPREADQLTYKVRFHLKDIKSPPLWREVTLSPSVSLLKVALIGLALFQFPESTPWTILPSPGSTECSIGYQTDGVTFDASEVPLSGFLQKKNDKLTLVTGNGVWSIELKLVEIDPRPLSKSELTGQKGGGFISSAASPEEFEQLREIASYTGPKLLGGYRKVLDNYGFSNRNSLRHAIMAMRSADPINQTITAILSR